MDMKCIVCEQKKGKRNCPAKNAMICPVCCGEKRMLEIPCPESCDYLITGREHEGNEYAKLLRSLDRKSQERNQQVFLNHLDVIGRLEYSISRTRYLSRDLTDKDVIQAVDLLLENYRTEEKGVLYEKTSENLRVESLRRELRDVMETFRNSPTETGPNVVSPQDNRLALSDALNCLECIRSLMGAFQEKGRSDSAYVDFLARFYPREESRSSIILS
jgi:hypothetical protein